MPALVPVDLTFPVFRSENKADRWIEARSYVDSYGSNPYQWRADKVELDHVLRVAFPELLDRPSAVVAGLVVVDSTARLEADPALDLVRAARADFERRIPSILLRAVARALVKEGIRKAADRESEGLGLLLNLAGAVAEQADTRGQALLPGRIDLVKAHLPEGEHQLAIRFLGAGGELLEERRHDVLIRPGTTLFLSERAFR